MLNRQNIPIVTGYLTMAVLFILTMNNAFFWDTVQLGSKQATYYFTTDFANILLPDSIDSGHIPAFGMYLALLWKVFGRSLLISHLAMLPFILGVLWQLQKLTERFVAKEFAGWAFLLVFLDPTLLSQLTLVSPDVPLVCFFLLGINSVIDNRKKMLALSLSFLFLTSMRGMMVSFCLLIIDIIKNTGFTKSARGSFSSLLKRSLIYLPAFIIFLSYSTLHYLEKGWIGFQEHSPWAALFERAGFTGFFYNIGILAWRILDFGRIGIWIVFLILLLRFKRAVLKTKQSHFLLLIFFVLLVVLPANMLWAKNLLGHRYLLPIYLSFSLLCAHILFTRNMGAKLRFALISLWLVSVLSGNLWIYPEKISQGWDSTLAHLPYYKIRKQALEYMDQQGIDLNEVQSFFPNNSRIDYYDLNNDYRKFAEFNNKAGYVLYSNVFNISDEEYELVRNHYSLIKRYKRGKLYMDICRKKQHLNAPEPGRDQ